MDLSTKQDYIKIANDLCYEKKYIDRLKEAKTEFQCESILADARHNSEIVNNRRTK